MADAPAGGNGWGALEVILAIILAIGLIATVTGHPIVSVTGPSTVKSTTNKTSSTISTKSGSGCGIIVSLPTQRQKISTVVTVKGIIAQCTNTSSTPDTLNAYVIDSTGTVLSTYTTMTVNKGFFADPNFSTIIPLQGTAHSTSAYVVINGPTRADGTALGIRVPITLVAATTTINSSTSTTNMSSYFVPTSYPSDTSGQTTTYTNTTTTNTNTTTTGNNGFSGSGGTTF